MSSLFRFASRHVGVLGLGLACLAALPVIAQQLRVEVDLSDQQMLVLRDATLQRVWPVSTARAGKCTPIGEFMPYLLERMHHSSLYNNAPMPHSIFFSGNYAIHGTTETARHGAPPPADCIRLAPENAEWLFEAVRDVGKAQTRIVIRE